MKRKSSLSHALSVVLACALSLPAAAQNLRLPERTTPRPVTTDDVPHIQIDIAPVPELSEQLLERVDAMTGVEIRRTVISLPGALGFWLEDTVPVANPGAIVRGREFAHIHPDGSLHASLNPVVAEAAIDAGWAVWHPWSSSRPGWEGFVMIYTPQSQQELDVVMELIASSYEYVTGQSPS